MPPEQLRGDKNIDCRSDIYALGAIFYEALTAEKAQHGSSCGEILYQLVTQAPVRIETRRPNLPAKLCAVVHRAMALDPAARFASVSEFRAALEPFARLSTEQAGTRTRFGKQALDTATTASSQSLADSLAAVGTETPRHRGRAVLRATAGLLIVALPGLGWLAGRWAARPGDSPSMDPAVASRPVHAARAQSSSGLQVPRSPPSIDPQPVAASSASAAAPTPPPPSAVPRRMRSVSARPSLVTRRAAASFEISPPAPSMVPVIGAAARDELQDPIFR
jgi:serine/threonine protein kinase